MSLHINSRLGMGFDIEHNDTVCHVVGDDEGRFIGVFIGLIIKIPFFSIYIGEFEEIDLDSLDVED